MIGKLVVAVAIMAMQPQSPSTAAGHRLESLDWMSGHWRTPSEPMRRNGPFWSEQVWTSANYLMVGASRTQSGFGRHSFSHMRIEEYDGVVTLYNTPSAGAALPHRMVGSAASEAVFENARHDSRITYRRDGDALIAIASRMDGSEAHSTRFVRRPPAPGGQR